eukprot:SAG31_NODE_4056_length_3632_cov_37.393999_3_plen_151_part_00
MRQTADEAQMFALRENAAAVAERGAARDKLERFIFKLDAKYNGGSDNDERATFPSSAAQSRLAAERVWLDESAAAAATDSDSGSIAELAERLAALSTLFPEDAKAEQASPPPPLPGIIVTLCTLDDPAYAPLTPYFSTCCMITALRGRKT